MSAWLKKLYKGLLIFIVWSFLISILIMLLKIYFPDGDDSSEFNSSNMYSFFGSLFIYLFCVYSKIKWTDKFIDYVDREYWNSEKISSESIDFLHEHSEENTDDTEK
jgi:tellurite resistance protein TehA-like permease